MQTLCLIKSTPSSRWITTTLCLIAALLTLSPSPADAARPNIIVIVSDDHRHDALGVVQRELGDKANFPFFKSPQLDKLAEGGVRFRNGFVTHSLCSPSRATTLSGLHTHAHGITFNEQPFVSKDTWPHVLSANGWKTGYFGKWHMGNQRERPGFQEQHGTSLVPLLTNAPGSVPWRKSFIYQNYKDPAYPKVTFDVVAVRTETHKYVENDGNPEWTQLFDLTADPGENRNLSGDPGSTTVLTEMKAELERLKEDVGYKPPPRGQLK